MYRGAGVVLPYYPGHLYAAYQPEDDIKVYDQNIINLLVTSEINICQEITVTLFTKKPDFLCYHDHMFDVVKVQVLIISLIIYKLMNLIS